MQHDIGDHALLADGHTAALIDPSGNVAWLCWPRIDSDPLLLGILDERRGGVFSVRPARPDATVLSRRYHPRTLVLETVWRVGRSRLTVDDALALERPPQLARRVRCEGDAVEVLVQQNFARAHAGAVVSCPGAWRDESEVRVCAISVGADPVTMSLHEDGVVASGDPVGATIERWRQVAPHGNAATLSSLGEGDHASQVRSMLETSACALLGLHQRGGGIVAAATTSLPQWPGTQRTWDYRYAWIRDCALAATAMLRLGLVDQAASLGAFLGEVTQRDSPPALVRVDGTAPPEERMIAGLKGYRGARPVRIGNAATHQLQIDIGGELTQLALALAARGALPAVLAAGCTRMAAWTVARWREPDHGIWEIRGEPRRYTHSQVMAWTALRDAATLARAGHMAGDATAWERAAAHVHEYVMRRGDALQLTDAGMGPDAALASVPLVGFLPAGHAVTLATLDLIAQHLDRNGLLDRCLPEHEALRDPCGPFLFPTFWMATALERAGRSGRRNFSAALASRGALGLFGEVADPSTRAPLGNFPQVQSHAAFILAATEA